MLRLLFYQAATFYICLLPVKRYSKAPTFVHLVIAICYIVYLHFECIQLCN